VTTIKEFNLKIGGIFIWMQHATDFFVCSNLKNAFENHEKFFRKSGKSEIYATNGKMSSAGKNCLNE
jgi:hypothetical protein